MDPDDLYGLPLDRFVTERTALAKALRAEGRREEAAGVAGMRKPSVAAWAVNQVVRTQRRAVQALFGAGDALREAQARLLAGRGDGRVLRAASERERAAVERLVDAARGLLTSHGLNLSGAVIERVADTLHAAALDEDAREQVREGRLERELRHVGLGLGLGDSGGSAPATPPRASKSKPRATVSADREPTPRARGERGQHARVAQQRAETERAKREQAAARKAARTAEASARRRVERAGHALRAAQERRERAAQALDEADQALAAAREESDSAAEVQRRTHADLENA